jgi:hypothetical protein
MGVWLRKLELCQDKRIKAEMLEFLQPKAQLQFFRVSCRQNTATSENCRQSGCSETDQIHRQPGYTAGSK